MTVPAPSNVNRFQPEKLGAHIRYLAEKKNRRHFVTFLVGAGFSRSAGIPLAGEIVRELRTEAHPLLDGLGPPPQGTSEYAFLMAALGSPTERAEHVKNYVNCARNNEGRLKINWSHLLLAALFEKGYVNRVLTTNFDPLVVEALAVTGQPIRTYDLNGAGRYWPGTLDPGTVVYLHGQMHSLLLANSPDEMEKLRTLYPKVLQEAVQDSIFIVVGYSGDCDPVLDSIAELPNFPRGLWWSHYHPSGGDPGEGVNRVFVAQGADCHLVTGDDSDTFMRKLVLDGMKIDLPGEVLKPITAMRLALERITQFPNGDIEAADPVEGALGVLRRAEELIDAPALPPAVDAAADPSMQPETLNEFARVVPIEMAALSGNWEEFERLSESVAPDPKSMVSNAVGDGLVRQTDAKMKASDFTAAIALLDRAASFGVTKKMAPWLPTVWGSALSGQAKIKGDTPQADDLFTQAASKFTEAVRIKPDMPEAYNNWGYALWDRAKIKRDTQQADDLFAQAGSKFAEAVRIEPDMYQAYNNWGIALWDQAKTKGDTPQADNLFTQAASKFEEAVRIKPDKPDAYNNWGIALSDKARIKGDTPQADNLFAQAASKFAEAVRIKPDMHETYYNWCGALSDQAKSKGDTPQADNLFAEAAGKIADAVRIKPEMHEAYCRWGTALLNQAKVKGDTPQADGLFTQAVRNFAEAVRIKPDMHEAYFNLGCLASLKADATGAVAMLRQWAQYHPSPSRRQLDNEPDFDRIRATSEFIAFRETLPY